MEFDELTHIWNDLDKQLESNLKVNQRLLKEVSIRKIKSFLSEVKFNAIFEIIANSLFTVFLLRFIVANFPNIKFLIPAIFLLGMMVLGMVLNVYRLSLMARIKPSNPVVNTQKILEQIRLYERQEINLLFVAIPIFSLAFIIVAAKALLGLDLYLLLGKWLLTYLAGSFIVGLIIVLFLKRFPDRNLQKALQFLGEIREFESNE